ncbi:MAG: hypothetical protein ABI114_11870 [Rhodanobacter sp.]
MSEEKVPAKDGAGGAVAAALIAAGMTAVTTAVSDALEMVKGYQRIACAVSNQTPFEMKQVIGKGGQPAMGQPVHGNYKEAPNATVPSLLQGASEDKASGAWVESNFTAWSLESRGSGTEVIHAYYIAELDLCVALYAGNPVSGGPYAGVSLSDKGWFDGEAGSDQKGQRLIKHIKDIHTKVCQLSKNGAPRQVNAGDILVEFSGAEQIVFRVKYTGDWSRFPLPE